MFDSYTCIYITAASAHINQGYLEHRDVLFITATDNCRVIKKSLKDTNLKQNQSVTCQNLGYIQKH